MDSNFHSSLSKDFSDDSLMVHNESIDPPGPALTASEDSPFVADRPPSATEPTNGNSGGGANNQEQETQDESNQSQSTTATSVKLAQHGDDGSNDTSNVNLSRLVGQSPALRDTEAYADNLAREILDDTNRLVRIRTEEVEAQQQQQPPTAQLINLDVSLPEALDPPRDDAATTTNIPDTAAEKVVMDSEPADSVDDTENSDKENKRAEIKKKAPSIEEDSMADVSGSSSENSGAPSNRGEESQWEYKSVLKEITNAADVDGNKEALSQVSDDLPQHQQQQQLEKEKEEKLAELQQTRQEQDEKLQQQQQDAEAKRETAAVEAMEFTKNYSDDLLMGQNDGKDDRSHHTTGADLADFELPPYSGSSSGSSVEPPRQQSSSPIKAQSTSTTTASSSHSAATGSSSSCPPSLSALRDLLKSNYSRISHIFHWKKPIESGICFGIGLTLIIALTFYSIISVVAYSALGLMLASGSIRLYKTVMNTLNRSQDTPADHIWFKVQALNVSMSHEKMHELVDSSLGNLNASLIYFKQVMLVEDKVATLKFGAFIYFLTYIGAWFNGMTLITIGYLGLFSVPILYEKNKTKIDELLNLATSHLCSASSMITNKIGSLVSSSPATSTTAAKKQD